jgi:phosphatidate cytidylyltransferase
MDSPPPSATAAASGRRVEFGRRLTSSAGLWGLVAVVFVIGHPAGFVLLVALLSLRGTLEFHRMAAGAGQPAAPILGVVGCIAYSFALHAVLLAPEDGTSAVARAFMVDSAGFCGFLFLLLLFRLGHPIDGPRTALGMALSLLAFAYLAFAFHFVARLIFLDWPGGTTRPPGAWLALWLVVVTKFTDTGAYLVGSLCGRHKMIPHISPAKSWEGLGGAFLFAQLAGCGLFALLPGELQLLGGWPQVILLNFLLAAAAVVGDLAESMVKRSLAIKDSGRSLPGIGGVMDLIDSLCFTAPLLYFVLLWHPLA